MSMHAPTPDPTRCLVVVPTYDEALTITRLLDDLIVATEADVLVVDDSSPDGTAALVRRHPVYGGRIHLLVRPGKAGLGAAYRAGFRWALNAGYDAVVQMDADFSHPVAAVPALIEALRTHDVAIGSRYVRGGRVQNWPWSRRLLSRLANQYVRMVLRLPVRDATAGFRACRASALGDVVDGTHSNGYCFQIEQSWRAARLGLTVVEVPITFTDRTEGESKMSTAIALEALTRVLGWRFGELRPQPRRARRTGIGPVVVSSRKRVG